MATKRAHVHEDEQTTSSRIVLTSNPKEDFKIDDLHLQSVDEDDTDSSDESYYSDLEEEETESSGEEESLGTEEEIESEEDNPVISDTNDSDLPLVHGKNESDEDTSDEEDARNTVGNIPLEWYNDYPHIGYDLSGKKIMKPATGDELDEFLAKMDDPNYWRTVKDRYTGKEVILTDEELDMIEKMQKSEFAQSSNPYEPYVDYFTNETMIHPLINKPATKRSFVPSKWENQKISKIIRAIRNGWITMKPGPKKPRLYMLWSDTDRPEQRKHQMHIPAPKMKLPGHEESYNPPPEYLPTEEEIKKWEETDPEDRERNFLPQKYNSLREVPTYSKFIKERFERCLDLYLCPRKLKMRVKIDDPDRLLPNLPKPKDLQPFPTTEAVVYRGHTAMVRCIAVETDGQWIASGSDDNTVKLWEVSTGRCMKTLKVDGTPHSIAFNSTRELSLVAVAVDNKVYVVNHGMDDRLVSTATDTSLSRAANIESSDKDSSKSVVEWVTEEDESRRDEGFRLSLSHPKPVKQVVWHSRGDYFATVMPEGGSASVQIHQLSKWRTQNPFQKSKGLIQRVAFHPSRPVFFVATQRYVRVYDLSKLELKKKLFSGVKWISSIDIHPQGDNVIIGSYDKRICWFDLDLSAKPYKVLRHHSQAVRQVCYHKRYPLFASCSDDGSVTICHGMVYSDLLQNALIVPVKVLKGHGVVNKLGVMDCKFHPTQPWIFTAGSDSTVRLYT